MHRGDRLISREMFTIDDEYRGLGGSEPMPGEAWEAWGIRKVLRRHVWVELVACSCDDWGRFTADPRMLAQMFMLGIGGPAIDWYAGMVSDALAEFESLHWIYLYESGPPGRVRQHGVVWAFVGRHNHRWARASNIPSPPSEAIRAEAIRRHLPPHRADMKAHEMSFEKFESLHGHNGSKDAWSRMNPELCEQVGRKARRQEGWTPPE